MEEIICKFLRNGYNKKRSVIVEWQKVDVEVGDGGVWGWF